MELLQLFDDNQNMLNEYIERSKKLEVPEGKYFMIILLFIENSEGKFLIQKVAFEDKYATTGGHVTFGDNALKTCIKEAKEELGLTLTKDEIKEIEVIKYPKAYSTVFYVKKNINIEDLKLQEEEVSGVYWMSNDDIEKLIDEGMLRKGNIEPYKLVLQKRKNVL